MPGITAGEGALTDTAASRAGRAEHPSVPVRFGYQPKLMVPVLPP